MGIADDDWGPTVRMQIGSLQLLLKECFHETIDARVISIRNTIHGDKATSLNYLWRAEDSLSFCLLLEELYRVEHRRRGNGPRE